jgi:inner membrane transporter RhtA
VVGAKVARLDRGVAGLGIGLAIGAVVIAPFGAPQSGPAWSSWTILGLCVLVGILSNAIGYGIEQSVLRAIPVRRFSVLLALLPVTAVVFGFIFLDQTPSWIDLVGIALVLVGVVVQQRDVIVTAAEST